MTSSFAPRYTEEFELNDLNGKQFLAVASEAAHQLEWEIYTITDNGFMAFTKKSLLGAYSEVVVKIEEHRAVIQSRTTAEKAVTDLGRNKKYTQALIEKISSLKGTLTAEEIDAKYVALSEKFSEDAEDALNILPEEPGEGINGLLALFKPVEGYFITPLLIDINILLFIGMVVSGANILEPDNESLLNWGANFRAMTLGGQWWRLLTSCFAHIGILHLLMNMYALLYIGILLEPLLGKARFLFAYLLTGLVASTTSLWWHELSIGAGASGAIFGMYGVFLALLTTDLIEATARKSMLSSIGVFVGYNLLFGLKGNIDNSAHLGGLLSGALLGYLMVPALKDTARSQFNVRVLGITAFVIIAGVAAVLYTLPNNLGEYDKRIKQFVKLEEKGLQIYSLPEETPEDVVLTAIRENGINSWKENINLIDGMKDLKLPDIYRDRLRELRDYSVLRLRMCELFYKSTEEHTDKYNEELQDCNKQIEAIIQRLSNPK